MNILDTFILNHPGNLLPQHAADFGGLTWPHWAAINGGGAVVTASGHLSSGDTTNGSNQNYRSVGLETSSGTDVTVKSAVVFHSAGAGGAYQLLARFSGTSPIKAYTASIDTSGNVVLGISAYTGSFVTLSTATVSLVDGAAYQIKFCLSETLKAIYLNGALVVSSTDNTLAGATGQNVGLAFWGQHDVSNGFDVQSFAAVDGVAPPFNFSSLSSTSVTVTPAQAVVYSGTATFAWQMQRAPDVSGSPSTWTNVGAAQTGLANGRTPSPLADSGLTPSTTYWYRAQISISGGATLSLGPQSYYTLAHTPGTWYVSATGSDAADGTSPGTAWATLGHVNAFGLLPGDTVLLHGGDTFAGPLTINPTVQPTAGSPIIIGSYGTGRAIVNAGTGNGVLVQDCGYVTIQDIEVAGPGVTISGTYPTALGSTTSNLAGIDFVLTVSATWRYGLVVHNCFVHGCRIGIRMAHTFGSSNADGYGLKHWRITNNLIDGCGEIGIHCGGGHWQPTVAYAFVDGVVSGNQITNTYGLALRTWGVVSNTPEDQSCGFSIFLGEIQHVAIEKNYCYNAGIAGSHTASGGGNASLIVVSSDHVTIRGNEVDLVYSPNLIDGLGIDVDYYCSNTVIEYNHILRAAGAAITVGGGTCIVRYNVVEQCGRYIGGGIGLRTWGTVTIVAYHNTFYCARQSGWAGSSVLEIYQGSLQAFNNILVWSTGMTIASVTGTAALAGNLYFGPSLNYSITVGSNTYTSLPALWTAGYEQANGLNVGVLGDPLFVNAGGGAAQMPAHAVSNLGDYDLLPGSPARGAAVNLLAVGILPIAPVDWHGYPSTGTPTAAYSGIDIGAVAYGSSANFGGGVIRTWAF